MGIHGANNGNEHPATRTLWEAIERRRDELIETVADLVRFPSVLGKEAGVQGYVAEHLRGSGQQVESWDLDDAIKQQPNAGESNVPFPGRPNVTGKRAGAGGGRSLILNGHVDVVSAEPVSAWQYDPWAAEIVGGRMYGRGAYDMKSGVALNLFLSRLLNDLNIPLRGDLTIHSVIEEECTGNGALAASLRDRADACIVTEPHFGDYTRAHLGVMWFRVRVEGKSAHAGHAWQGVNAIVKMAPIVLALRDLDNALNEHVHPLWEGVTHPINLNVGVIEGGDWPSTVPGECRLHCRTSFFPDMSKEELRARIVAAVEQAAREDEWLREHPPVVTFDGFQTDGVILASNEPFLQVLKTASETVTGKSFEGRIATAVNDMRYYIFQGVPSTCFGAAGANAHAADEWLDLTSMAPAAKALAKFIVDWCGVAD
jgi:acetylornithine deacetylase